jgi:hypothetical protein
MISKGWRPQRNALVELGIPGTIVDLLLQCWQENQKSRPTFAEVLEYLEKEARAEIMPSLGGPDTQSNSRRSSTSGSLRLRILGQKRAEEGSKGEEDVKEKIDEGISGLMDQFGGGEHKDYLMEKLKVALEGREGGGGGAIENRSASRVVPVVM